MIAKDMKIGQMRYFEEDSYLCIREDFCGNCAFHRNNKCEAAFEVLGNCSWVYRDDATNVIFIKVKEE